jgi:hypothetical protein
MTASIVSGEDGTYVVVDTNEGDYADDHPIYIEVAGDDIVGDLSVVGIIITPKEAYDIAFNLIKLASQYETLDSEGDDDK